MRYAICGTDITNAVLKAKNGDYSELKAGDIIGRAYSTDAEEPEIAVGDIYVANENLYLYAVWKEVEMLGDVNADGAIDQYDYILVKRHYFETRHLTDAEFSRGDVNKDGTVNQYDYILISRHYFGTYVIGQ